MVETEIMLYSLLWLDNILVIHSTVAMELLEMLCTFVLMSFSDHVNTQGMECIGV